MSDSPQAARLAEIEAMARYAIGRSHLYSRQKLVRGLRDLLAELARVQREAAELREALRAKYGQPGGQTDG